MNLKDNNENWIFSEFDVLYSTGKIFIILFSAQIIQYWKTENVDNFDITTFTYIDFEFSGQNIEIEAISAKLKS